MAWWSNSATTGDAPISFQTGVLSVVSESNELDAVTLWLCQNSYWNWPFIVSFPIKNGGSFHSYVNVYQRVLIVQQWTETSHFINFPEAQAIFFGKWVYVYFITQNQNCRWFWRTATHHWFKVWEATVAVGSSIIFVLDYLLMLASSLNIICTQIACLYCFSGGCVKPWLH